jgi:hypothetical protein
MPTVLDLSAEFEGFWIAYWALFGAVNILTFPLAYIIFDGLTLLALAGLGLYVGRARRDNAPRPLLAWGVLIVYMLALFVGIVRWTSMTPASQGRLMFPAIGAISALIWLGWETVWGGAAMARLRTLKWSVPIGMLLIAAQAPFADILPTYSAPRFIDRADVPADVQALNVVFDGRIKLIGVASSRQVESNNRASFVIYWQCLTRMSENYSVFVSLKGRHLAEVGKLDAYPRRGLFATSDCPAGAVFADAYRIPIEADIERPVLLRAQIGLTDWTARQSATLTDGAGNPILALLFDIAPLPSVADVPAPVTRTDVAFGDVIRLDGYTLTEDAARHSLQLDLHWSTMQPPPDDYTVFVHLLDAHETLIAQWDEQPLAGDYPTRWWQPGEHVLDSRTLPLPVDLAPGRYHLAIGLYRAPDGVRLPARDAGNAPVPGDRVLIERAVSR